MAIQDEKFGFVLRDETTGEPLSGQLVELREGANNYVLTEIATSGFYQIDVIPTGKYSVFANSVDTGHTKAVGSGQVAALGNEADNIPVSTASAYGFQDADELKTTLDLNLVENVAIPNPTPADQNKVVKVDAAGDYVLSPESTNGFTAVYEANTASEFELALGAPYDQKIILNTKDQGGYNYFSNKSISVYGSSSIYGADVDFSCQSGITADFLNDVSSPNTPEMKFYNSITSFGTVSKFVGEVEPLVYIRNFAGVDAEINDAPSPSTSLIFENELANSVTGTKSISQSYWDNTSGSGGGTLQDAYDGGELITTDVTNTEVKIRSGTGNDGDKILVGQNGDGTDTFEVRGDGCVGATTLDIVHEAVATDDHALEIDANANGLGDVKAVDIVYNTGAIGIGDDEAGVLVNIDKSASTGGEVTALEVLSTEGGAQVIGMLAGVEVNPVEQFSGSFGNMDSALNNGVDALASFTNPAVNTQLFVSDNHTVTIGNAVKFEEIEFLFSIFANQNINPTFEFSTGVGTWNTFSPIDGTNGCRNNGVIAWLDADIPTWAVGTGSEYLIRITRTRNGLSTPPTEEKVQIAEVTEYYWNKDGDLLVNDISATSTSGDTTHTGENTFDEQIISPNGISIELAVNYSVTALPSTYPDGMSWFATSANDPTDIGYPRNSNGDTLGMVYTFTNNKTSPGTRVEQIYYERDTGRVLRRYASASDTWSTTSSTGWSSMGDVVSTETNTFTGDNEFTQDVDMTSIGLTEQYSDILNTSVDVAGAVTISGGGATNSGSNLALFKDGHFRFRDDTTEIMNGDSTAINVLTDLTVSGDINLTSASAAILNTGTATSTTLSSGGDTFTGANVSLLTAGGGRLRTNGTAIIEWDAVNTKIVNQLNLSGLPTSASGLSSGDVWNDSGTLKIV